MRGGWVYVCGGGGCEGNGGGGGGFEGGGWGDGGWVGGYVPGGGVVGWVLYMGGLVGLLVGSTCGEGGICGGAIFSILFIKSETGCDQEKRERVEQKEK